jgi:magnesium transporter
MTDKIQNLFNKVSDVLRSGNKSELSQILAKVLPSDVAEIYDLFDNEDRSRLIDCLPEQLAADMIIELDDAERNQAIGNLEKNEIASLVEHLEPDDATDILNPMPENEQAEILSLITEEQSEKVEELLAFGKDTAGGIMTKNLVVLSAESSVNQAIEKIRDYSSEEDIHFVYIVDKNGILTGVIPLRYLLLNDRDAILGSIGIRDVISVMVNDDQEEVIHAMSKYDLPAIPVVDVQGKLVGRITHDDILDAFEQEADEDMFRMAGLATSEFEKSSIIRAASIRLSWLIPALVSMAITAAVLLFSQGWFDDLMIYAILIIFVPMIAAIGGNSGIQIATVIVRGLATGDLAETNFKMTIKREGRIALIMAPVCGLVAWTISRFGLPVLQQLSHSSTILNNSENIYNAAAYINKISLSVGIGMTCAILVAGTLGLILPFLFRRIGADPAIASGPVVTTANDIISVTIFLGLSSIVMSF